MSPVSGGECRVFDTPDQLARAAADWIVERAQKYAQRFALCLSGGTSTKQVYELLGEAPRRCLFPWQDTYWFWGDERFVSQDDPRSAVVAFLVTGERKREALSRVRAGDPALPATALQPHGAILWFADRAAATALAMSGV